jgi:hypothetical protein
MRLRIGTRGSDLALWQARHVAGRLGGVDVGDRHLRAAAHLLAEGCVLPGHRAGGSDDDLRPGGAAKARQQGGQDEFQGNVRFHRG